ncbi:hypothetical protein HRE53_27295 (plasmid) [Acaryochloris sp. 'Moss Beach']|uniref:hypothetical protein n=1 Tax=Acaryochloris TaxID=155977 RepID=UPI001BAFC890|nr:MULTISPECIES: hypothetical protein [Acaryochloris]QUY45751.1 hypothetical protein I1H34_28775 [Acaryochloris marina S15]UJB72305.1 hypothetical protein HRE53_27295 [Acaryochloris sp. 'Moss Beach']
MTDLPPTDETLKTESLSPSRERLKQRLWMLFVWFPLALLVAGMIFTFVEAPDSCKQSLACFTSYTLSSVQRGLGPIVDPVGTLLYAPGVVAIPLILVVAYVYYFVFTTILQVLYALLEVVIVLQTRGRQDDTG